MGHWIPEAVVNYQLTRKNFREFKDAINCQLDRDLNGIIKKIESDWKYLKESGLIEEGSPVEKFKKDIENLKKDDIKLWRIFSKHEFFHLPYNFTQKTQVEALYDSFKDSFDKRKIDNEVKRILRGVFCSLDISPITNFRVSK